MSRHKEAIKTAEDFRVWCAGCSIRVAPHEEQVALDGQTYHPRCYSKHSARPLKTDKNVKASRG